VKAEMGESWWDAPLPPRASVRPDILAPLAAPLGNRAGFFAFALLAKQPSA